MPRSHKPRHRYVPKRVDHDPADLAIARATVLTAQQRTDYSTPAGHAFRQMRAGHGDANCWAALADAMNVAERLADIGICSDRKPEILQAQDALSSLFHRHAERKSWTLRGPEVNAIEAGITFARIQLGFATQGELQQAILTVQRCVSQALAGNASPGARVCVIGALGRAVATANGG